MTGGAANSPAPKLPPVPPLQRAAQIMAGAALFGGGGAMLVSPHLPSPLGVKVAVAYAALAGLWAGWECRAGGAFGPERMPSNRLGRLGILRIPLMAVFVFGLSYELVANGLLAVETAVAGVPGSRTLTVDGVSYASKSCDHFDVREAGWVLDRALCASGRELGAAKAGDQLVVFGRQGPFGLNVERHELRPASHM